MIENIRFANPIFFSLLLLIPVLIWYEKNIKKYPSIKFSSTKILEMAQSKKLIKPSFILLGLRLITITLFIFTLARPQQTKTTNEILTEGVNIMLNIDTSGSMAAIDMEVDKDRVTRLDVVKKVIKEFIPKRTNDPIGLVVFGTEAYTQCPLTLDSSILNEFVSNLEIGMAGEQTCIGNSIALAVNRLKESKAKSKIVILLTDGANTAGRISPEKATEIARTFGIKIYTIGIGTTGRIPFVQNSPFGPQIVYGKADLDEPTLKMIADKTGAKYYRAKNTEELQKIYNDIDKLEKSEVKVKNYTEYKELFYIFLLPALLTLFLEIILSNTIFMRIP